MGSTFIKRLSKAAHTIRVTDRDLSKAQKLAVEYVGVTEGSVAEALGDNNVVILTTGYRDVIAALRGLGDRTGKVVIDITNPLNAGYSGLVIGHDEGAYRWVLI